VKPSLSESAPSERQRVLLLAYGFGQADVSESYTAFSLARELAHDSDLVVLTKDAPTGAPPRGIQIVHLPTGASAPRAGGLRRALKADYFGFNVRAWRLARSGRLGAFALTHHVSPISLRYPDLLSRLPVPFIWGPVGGSLTYPPGFEQIASRERGLVKLRGFDRLRLRFDPLLRSTMRRAARIVVTSTDALQLIPAEFRGKALAIPEGVDPAPPSDAPSPAPGLDYVFSSSRMVPFKALDLLLRAFASTPLPLLVISGDGPERPRLQTLIDELGIGARVRLLGAIGKAENLAWMRHSRFCVFPSLREPFGHVNLEAMSQERAVIACAHGGPRDIVADGVTGLLVTPVDLPGYIAGLRSAMERLFADPGLARQMGQAGRRRAVEAFSWPAVARRYLRLYAEVTAGASDRRP
jgi:glycosyltransferase involved in cell wall biosynthesis